LNPIKAKPVKPAETAQVIQISTVKNASV
jgi:hypothetical protein